MGSIGKGDWVQCINGRPSSVWWDRGVVRAGAVYCVERVVPPDAWFEAGLILTDPETKEWDDVGEEGAWRIDRFKPLGGNAKTVTAPSQQVRETEAA